MPARTREGAGLGHGGFGVELGRGGSRDDTAALGALFPEDAGQLAGVDAGDGDDVLGLEVGIQRLFAAPVGRHQRQVANDETSGKYLAGLAVFTIDTGVADVRGK